MGLNMPLDNGLLLAQVMHKRLAPKTHRLNYSVYYLCFPLSRLSQLANFFLSLERFNLFSFYQQDHGFQSQSPTVWIKQVLQEWQLDTADGEIVLLTLPRILGYVFNPVSFWFCLDQSGQLRAVLAEVNNTFGERHSYLCFHDDQRVIQAHDQLTANKIFHVSPFLKVEGHYRFRFAYSEQKIGVWIDYYDNEQKILATSLTGKRFPLTQRRLLTYFFRYPLITLKVIGLIHYHALKMIVKGLRPNSKPPAPSQEISR